MLQIVRVDFYTILSYDYLSEYDIPFIDAVFDAAPANQTNYVLVFITQIDHRSNIQNTRLHLSKTSK